MRSRRRVSIAAVVLLAVLGGWLFLGVFQHREHGDYHLFLKHQPSFKVFFRAARGEPERKDLSAEERHEEAKYVEFVEQGDGERRSIGVWR